MIRHIACLPARLCMNEVMRARTGTRYVAALTGRCGPEPEGTSWPPPNKKRLLLPANMARAGWALVERRDDVEGVKYTVGLPTPDFHKALGDVDGVAPQRDAVRHGRARCGPRMQAWRASASATTRSTYRR